MITQAHPPADELFFPKASAFLHPQGSIFSPSPVIFITVRWESSSVIYNPLSPSIQNETYRQIRRYVFSAFSASDRINIMVHGIFTFSSCRFYKKTEAPASAFRKWISCDPDVSTYLPAMLPPGCSHPWNRSVRSDNSEHPSASDGLICTMSNSDRAAPCGQCTFIRTDTPCTLSVL